MGYSRNLTRRLTHPYQLRWPGSSLVCYYLPSFLLISALSTCHSFRHVVFILLQLSLFITSFPVCTFTTSLHHRLRFLLSYIHSPFLPPPSLLPRSASGHLSPFPYSFPLFSCLLWIGFSSVFCALFSPHFSIIWLSRRGGS